MEHRRERRGIVIGCQATLCALTSELQAGLVVLCRLVVLARRKVGVAIRLCLENGRPPRILPRLVRLELRLPLNLRLTRRLARLLVLLPLLPCPLLLRRPLWQPPAARAVARAPSGAKARVATKCGVVN